MLVKIPELSCVAGWFVCDECKDGAILQVQYYVVIKSDAARQWKRPKKIR